MRIVDNYYTLKKLGLAMNIYVLPDAHFGSPAFLECEFNRLATIIENDPLAYVIVQGDLIDSNRPSTREIKRVAYASRKDEQVQEDERNEFWIENKIIPKLKRIIKKGRCLGMLDGDHYLETEGGLSTTQMICARLGVPYLGDGQAIIRLHFGMTHNFHAAMITIHCQHGVGGTGRLGSGVNKLEDMCNIWENVDIFVRGHSHKGFIYPTSKYYVPQKHKAVRQKDIWLVNTPSFRTGILMDKTDYAERKSYGALAHKFPVIHIGFDRREKEYRNLRHVITGELL